jgi:hypothetical protein
MSALGSDNEDLQLGSENGNGSENENSESQGSTESLVDQNDENWVFDRWRSICHCPAQFMEQCSCDESPLKFAFQDGKWHDDVQQVINELATAKLFDIDELSHVAHFALETLPVEFAVECLQIFRRGSGDPSKLVINKAERLRDQKKLTEHEEPDIYRTRVKAPVCNGSAAVSAAVVSVAVVSAAVVSDDVIFISDDTVVVCNGGPAPNATESKNKDAHEAGVGASVGEKKKRSTSLAELETKLKRNKAAIDKNMEEFRANRAAAVILNEARKAMLDEKKTKKAKQKPKKPNQKPKKPKKDNKKA